MSAGGAGRGSRWSSKALFAVGSAGAAGAVPVADPRQGAVEGVVEVGGVEGSGRRVGVGAVPGGSKGGEFFGDRAVLRPAGWDGFTEVVAFDEAVNPGGEQGQFMGELWLVEGGEVDRPQRGGLGFAADVLFE